MSEAREELEKLFCHNCLEKNKCYGYATLQLQPPQLHPCPWRKEFTQVILDRLPKIGFVRLKDVKIDRERLFKLILKGWTTEDELATAIASAKGILRVKEGK